MLAAADLPGKACRAVLDCVAWDEAEDAEPQFVWIRENFLLCFESNPP